MGFHRTGHIHSGRIIKNIRISRLGGKDDALGNIDLKDTGGILQDRSFIPQFLFQTSAENIKIFLKSGQGLGLLGSRNGRSRRNSLRSRLSNQHQRRYLSLFFEQADIHSHPVVRISPGKDKTEIILFHQHSPYILTAARDLAPAFKCGIRKAVTDQTVEYRVFVRFLNDLIDHRIRCPLIQKRKTVFFKIDQENPYVIGYK